MFDVGEISRISHGTFEVPVVISREGEADRDEAAVLDLASESWDQTSGMMVISSHDRASFMNTVDVKRGDLLTCSDSRAVATETTWELTGKDDNDDGWVQTWRLRKT